MPKHLRLSVIEIITDGGSGSHWTAAATLRIVEAERDRDPLSGHASPRKREDQACMSIVARRNGVVHSAARIAGEGSRSKGECRRALTDMTRWSRSSPSICLPALDNDGKPARKAMSRRDNWLGPAANIR